MYMSTDAAAATHQYIMLPVATAPQARSPPSAMEPSGSWSQKRKETNHQEYKEYEWFVTNRRSMSP